ncbi:MAG: alpha/beta fold hydrolase [Acidimicrobiales bacterium]
MPALALSAGTIDYLDTGGDGPPLLLLHGLLMDESLFTEVVARLRDEFRCLVPVLPLGSHRIPLRGDADLSLAGLVALVVEFMDRVGVARVTLIGSDLGLAQCIAAAHPDRLTRLVLCAQEAFENFPPGLPGKAIHLAARIPGGVNAAVQPLRIRALRRQPFALGRMSVRRIPDEVTDRWFAPALQDRGVRRDLAKYAGPIDRRAYVGVAEQLRAFSQPTLIVWGKDDRVMPPQHGRRLAAVLPRARLVEFEDCGTLISLDQPVRLAEVVRSFIGEAA